MGGYISKEDALNLICCRCPIAINCPPFKCSKYRNFAENIAAMMLVDVKPVVRGKWIPKWGAYRGVNAVEDYFRCSVCNAPEPVKKNFCPNCGAEMSDRVD